MSASKIYDPKRMEAVWTQKWADEGVYRTDEESGKPKAYVLGMFPYPSAEGLHTGHVRIYTACDVLARYLRMKGEKVLLPMGWDSFGLPAENAAIKRKVNPMEMVPKNEVNFKRQMELMGLSYDWGKQFSTTDPEYYKWTQWLFLKLYSMKNKQGERLVYRKKVAINWCPFCKTGLANEEVLGDGTHERCGTQVEQRLMPQWVMRITDYAERLLADLEGLDWPKGILEMQRNWIGKKEGVKVKFEVTGGPEAVEVFTTRLDTIFGVTLVVVAPELAKKWMTQGWAAGEKVAAYVEESLAKTEQTRLEEAKEKTGVATDLMAVNPVSGEAVPVWVADYVLGEVGTGAVMGVPAHDGRDMEFARKYKVGIKAVVVPQREYVDANAKDYYIKRTQLHKELLTDLIQEANRAGKKIMIGGGWAVSFQVDQEFRDFEDIDLVVMEDDLEWWREQFVAKGLKLENLFPEGKNPKFYFQATKQNIHVDVAAIRINDAGMVIWLDGVEPKESDLFDKMFEEKRVGGETVYVMNKDLLYYLKKKKEIRWKEQADFAAMGFEPYESDGVLVSSGKYNGMKSQQAREEIADDFKSQVSREVNYHLRDWVFSRQRYWGEPFPLMFCEKCGDENGVVTVPEEQLPVELPYLQSYEPSETGESPLVAAEDWVETTCPTCGGKARRETDTMPNWAGSCWYFLRFADPKNREKAWDGEALKQWLPVDWYLGGAEHAVLHLLYARFWTKAFKDLGLLTFDEPFTRLRSVGLVLAEDGRKMSKSWGNVVNPDEMVEKFGADAVRLYEMFMGPWDQAIAWDTRSIIGCYRFLEKAWKLVLREGQEESDPALRAKLNKVVEKVGKDIPALKFNTAVAALMELVNAWSQSKQGLDVEDRRRFVLVLAPLAPFAAEELYQTLVEEDKVAAKFESVHRAAWPKVVNGGEEERVMVVMQVNGKTRAVVQIESRAALDKETVVERALAEEKVKKWLEEGYKEVVFVPGRLVNFVV